MAIPIGPLLLGSVIAAALVWRARKGTTVVSGGPPGTIVDVSPLAGDNSASVSPGQTVRINLSKEWILLQDVGVDPASMPMQVVPARGIGGFTFTAAFPGKQTLTFSKAGMVGPGTSKTVTIEVRPEAVAATGYGAYGGNFAWNAFGAPPWWASSYGVPSQWGPAYVAAGTVRQEMGRRPFNVGTRRPFTTGDRRAFTTGQRYYRRPGYRAFWQSRWYDPTWRWREQQWRLRGYWEPAWGERPPVYTPPAPTVPVPAPVVAPADPGY